MQIIFVAQGKLFARLKSAAVDFNIRAVELI